MKSLGEMLTEQSDKVAEYRSVARKVTAEHLAPQQAVLGVLLTGSVARGDARKRPFGLYIDLEVVVNNRTDINLVEILGPSIEPYIPKHCVVVDNAAIALEIVTMNELNNVRSFYESVIFAKQESMILFDRNGLLSKWKQETFTLSEDDIKNRALQQYFRFDYLTNEYRTEKWTHREAWVQMTQNGNEAVECYCNFIYCINGWFIPRKDWLVYFTYDLKTKVPNHNNLMNELYSVKTTEEGIKGRSLLFKKLYVWMRDYCAGKEWIKLLPDK
jgi:hypothetical protein